MKIILSLIVVNNKVSLQGGENKKIKVDLATGRKQSPFCFASISLSIRFMFSLGLMISGRIRSVNIEETIEIYYELK